MNDDFDWTEAAVARLETLWLAGKTVAEIGAEIGVGKNAVAGKAHRLKLPARPSPIAWKDGVPRPAHCGPGGLLAGAAAVERARAVSLAVERPAVKRADEVVLQKASAVGKTEQFVPVAVLAPRVREGCRYITDDTVRSRVVFCDAPRVNGGSWCAEHHRIVFVPPQDRAAGRVPWGFRP